MKHVDTYEVTVANHLSRMLLRATHKWPTGAPTRASRSMGLKEIRLPLIRVQRAVAPGDPELEELGEAQLGEVEDLVG